MNAGTQLILKTKTFSVLLTGLLLTGCAPQGRPESEALVEAWRGKVQFKNGVFASVKDLEFMYIFNEGGTMMESSNYDGAPPVPPAYGVWRKIEPNQFEARYEFFSTRPPANFDEIVKGGGWLPSGHGVFVEKIVLSEDGYSFKSEMRYKPFDKAGNAVEGSCEAEVHASRMKFQPRVKNPHLH